MQELIQVFGRFHPLVLHAPIGMLGAMAVIELIGLKRPDESVRRVFAGLAWLTALAAAVAVLSGWLLSREGGYDELTVDRHFNLGIATAVLATLLAISSHFKAHALPRRGLLVLTLLVLVPTGHFGATMTHGEDFLLEPLQAKAKGTPRGTGEKPGDVAASPSRESPAASVSTASLLGNGGAAAPIGSPDMFTRDIAPILADTCLKCHGASKQKGGLDLRTPDSIRLGGDGGPVIDPSKPDASELLVRLRLPLSDEDHMPPKGKPQPTEAQIAAIEAWIKSGAPMPDAAVSVGGDASQDGRASNTDPAKGEAESTASAEPLLPPKPTGPAPAGADAIAAIHASLVHVEPVSVDSTLLIVSFNAIAPNVDDALAEKLLSPIQANVADLSLARTKVTDKAAELLAAMPNLRRLDLRGTPITPAAVATLARSESLQELILAQTRLSDDIVPTIVGMNRLSHVFLWNAGLSTESIAKLRAERPELEVDAGDRLETQNLGAEEPLKFSSDAPPPGQPLAGPASLEPINKVCPITGNPINPKYLVVYEGKVIGFCCPNCPKEFWANPEACLAALKAK